MSRLRTRREVLAIAGAGVAALALRQARTVNPGLFLLASPWSPPGWMKANGSMLGGSMRKR